MADADLTLVVIDLSNALTAEDREFMERLGDRKPLLAGNKCDLERRLTDIVHVLPVSALTGEGIPELRRAILRNSRPTARCSRKWVDHKHPARRAAARKPGSAPEYASRRGFRLPHEMLLLDLYAALRPIDAVTGATTADDILNRIFSTFCIGK